MNRPLGSAARWALALIVIGSVIPLAVLPLIQAPPTGGGIAIDPSTVFRPSASWAEIHFASPQTFLVEVNTGPTGVTFDGVTFELEKTPKAPPRANVTIRIWAPQADGGSTAVEFVATSVAGDTVWVNVTGLRGDTLYDLHVDQVWQSRSATPGRVSFSWTMSSTHTFGLIANAVGPPSVDDLPPAPIADLLTTFLREHDVRLEWTAPGDDNMSGQATLYELRYREAGPITQTNFANGSLVPTSVPQPAARREQVNVTGLSPDTLYWFAIRAADEVPNWSPISNVVEVLTPVDPTDPIAAARPPAVNGVWFTPTRPQLDVVFTKSMNRTSVEQALTIDPAVFFRTSWTNDAHVSILLDKPLSQGAAYHLVVESAAADQRGNLLGTAFTFRFETVQESPGTEGIPLSLLIGLLAGGIAMTIAVAWVPLLVFLSRVRRKSRTLQRVVIAQAKRIMELRGRVLPWKGSQSREIVSYRSRK